MLRLRRVDSPHVAPPVKRKHRQKRRHFIVAWMRAPLKVGALVPSSRGLARSMARQVDIDLPGVVIELGAGTGVMTFALLQAGVDPERLIVIERDPRFHSILKAQFPQLNILCADAAELDRVLAEHKITQVSAVVSSLPLLSMPKAVRHAIAQQMVTVIGKEGKLIQFTYGPGSPIIRDLMRRQNIVGRRMKTVIANVPPAHVWVYRKERRTRSRK